MVFSSWPVSQSVIIISRTIDRIDIYVLIGTQTLAQAFGENPI